MTFRPDMPTLVAKTKSFDGYVETYTHASGATNTPMRFSIYRPPQAEKRRVPVLYWLSGLTCTDENFMTKSGVQRFASEHGILVVAPDTSPRGANLPGEADSWDFGLGAGYYVNATTSGWKNHYRMYDYCAVELPTLLREYFPIIPDREAISGHSMGGHGALVLSLTQPGRYLSVSAFAPISAPSLCPWGQKAFTKLLGDDRAAWGAYDAHLLVNRAEYRVPFLVDQGMEDKFLAEQLKPEALEEACARVGYPLELRRRAGYDHSYYFVATFLEEHIAYHAARLNSF